MPTWLTALLPLIQEAPSVLDGLTKLFQHVHNEMVAGSGSTNPSGITAALVENAAEIASAINSTPSAAEEKQQGDAA